MEVSKLKNLSIAHRGIQKDGVIENTLSAFSLALQKKVPIEFDIHLLKDGNLVVYHDSDLNRLFGINRKLSSYTYSELKQLTFPYTNSHIPLFSDVLKLVSGKVLLIIEIKRTKITSVSKYCQKIVEELKNYPDDVVIQSFDIKIVHWFLKHTNYFTGLLISHPFGRNWITLYSRIMNTRLVLAFLKPHFISVNYRILLSKAVQTFRKRGPVFVWTIQDMDTFRKVKEYADTYLLEKIDIW